MIVLMAGLPGSGKSTLARELAARTTGPVLDKDRIRAALFAPADIEYSTRQDDFCQQIMIETAAYLVQTNPSSVVFFDGRTFSRRVQLDRAVAAAESWQQPWRILHCICSDETASRRLEEQAASREHPARNRDYRLYLEVKARFEAITLPETLINTDQPLGFCLQVALAALS